MSNTQESATIINIPNATPNADDIIECFAVILTDDVMFPHTTKTLYFDERLQESIKQANEQAQTLITLTARYSSTTVPTKHRIYNIGTEVAIDYLTDNLDGIISVIAQGRRRVEIVNILSENPLRVQARILAEPQADKKSVNTARDALENLFGYYVDNHQSRLQNSLDNILNIDDTSIFIDTIASKVPFPIGEQQRLLETLDVQERLDHLYTLLDSGVLEETLGGGIFQQEIREIEENILQAQLPSVIHDTAMKELSRLSVIMPMAPEAGVIRTYLDWLVDLPWNEKTEDNLDIAHAEKVLESAHFGLKKVKERILEHIAVRKLAKDKMKSPILCFVGAPGVGKTSIGKSIAEALGRKFIRISLGGVRDEAEIRGHRRTYIGALPGRIIQAMRRAETVNPVFMLDEIDKLTMDFHGDPAAALLEVLDPEQNYEFSDHYLDVPYDLSQVLFITTANDLYPIPEALEDRMEIIEFMGYTEEEKVQISKRFLIPKQLEANGIGNRGIQISDQALQTVIRDYTYEAGVRNLEREIANICRKITKLVALEKKYPKRITPTLVGKQLGAPYYSNTRVNKTDSVGLVTGLVWTRGGGDIQTIEISIVPGKGNLTLTGQLGEVLQESAHTALSYLRSQAKEFDIPHEDFDNYDVHVHMPEGSVPKDGPSAGITLAIALISAFTERKVRSDIAMTGEITLRGHVLPVGGISEKVMSARRHTISNVILPADNRKDWDEIPKQVQKDITVHWVETMKQVLDLTLLDIPDVRQRDLDKQENELDEDDEE